MDSLKVLIFVCQWGKTEQIVQYYQLLNYLGESKVIQEDKTKAEVK
ncbi:hypothetical protein [Bacillus safensis]|nr:hypothetical protein [Bacillus safensis]MCY7737665.1 hypothetical protein [Bacillus safensis]